MATGQSSMAEVLARYGRCVELTPLDPNFHGISVGLYVKDGVATVWTFSRRPDVQERIRQIRDKIAALGGLVPVEGAYNQARYPCGQFHEKPIKFLMMQAVEKRPDFAPPEGETAVKDNRTGLTLRVEGRAVDGRWVYRVSGEGEVPNLPARLHSVAQGFVRYGGMELVDKTTVAFSCGHRHDELARLLLPFARNISAVESLMDASALRGQLTTGTAGFTPA